MCLSSFFWTAGLATSIWWNKSTQISDKIIRSVYYYGVFIFSIFRDITKIFYCSVII